MSTAVALHNNGYTGRQLDVIKRTVAKDTNEDEFNMFVEYCRTKQLDPFTKQAIIVVYNKDKPEKRQPTIITTQEGYRALAARCQDYRPAAKEPEFTYEDWWIDRQHHLKEARKIGDRVQRDKRLKEINEDFPIDPTNPDGLEKCTVTLFKQDPRNGEWHPVNGWARWRDYAPVKEEWTFDPETNKRKPSGRVALDASGNWAKMGHVMIAKCANSAALRAGWPAVFAGVYSEEEFDRSNVIDLTATEMVEQEREQRRMKSIAMSDDEYPFVDHEGTLTFMPAGRYADHIIMNARNCTELAELDGMKTRNREGLARFWTKHKDDALEINAEIERLRAALVKKA